MKIHNMYQAKRSHVKDDQLTAETNEVNIALKYLIVILLIALSASTCGQSTQAVDVSRLTDVTWEATEISGKPIATPGSVTLSIADGQASGRSGCNRYSGTVTVSHDRIGFGPLRSTKMGCTKEGAMQTEMAYLQALSGADTWLVSGDGQLTISGSNGRVLFKPASHSMDL